MMANPIPSIACLGVIGRNNNPLHITIFPSHEYASAPTRPPAPIRTPLQFSLLLSSTLDIFAARARGASASNLLLSGDFGLLHAVDERLAVYGFETNTGVKFVAVVDMRGGVAGVNTKAGAGLGGVGLREAELKVVFRAMQTAYVRLLQNPFYEPEATGVGVGAGGGGGAKRITSRRFAEEMRRIGEGWAPGVTSL